MIRTSQDLGAARSFYTHISSIYDALAARSEHRAQERGLSLLGARDGERILEIGFGTGSSLVPLAVAVGTEGQIFGVDISPGMKAIAEQRLRSTNPTATVSLAVAAVPPIPFGDCSFDAVFMVFTLELFPDETIPDVLREVRRTLRTGGRFVVVSMALRTARARERVVERVYQWLHRHFPQIVDCHPIDVERSLTAAGFTIARAEHLEICGLPVVAALVR